MQETPLSPRQRALASPKSTAKPWRSSSKATLPRRASGTLTSQSSGCWSQPDGDTVSSGQVKEEGKVKDVSSGQGLQGTALFPSEAAAVEAVSTALVEEDFPTSQVLHTSEVEARDKGGQDGMARTSFSRPEVVLVGEEANPVMCAKGFAAKHEYEDACLRNNCVPPRRTQSEVPWLDGIEDYGDLADHESSVRSGRVRSYSHRRRHSEAIGWERSPVEWACTPRRSPGAKVFSERKRAARLNSTETLSDGQTQAQPSNDGQAQAMVEPAATSAQEHQAGSDGLAASAQELKAEQLEATDTATPAGEEQGPQERKRLLPRRLALKIPNSSNHENLAHIGSGLPLSPSSPNQLVCREQWETDPEFALPRPISKKGLEKPSSPRSAPSSPVLRLCRDTAQRIQIAECLEEGIIIEGRDEASDKTEGGRLSFSFKKEALELPCLSRLGICKEAWDLPQARPKHVLSPRKSLGPGNKFIESFSEWIKPEPLPVCDEDASAA